MKQIKYESEEKEILDAFERGEGKRVKGFEKESMLIRKAAVNTLRKDCRVNIRISNRDLDGLRSHAAQEGLPYQTLIASILHKYVTGKLRPVH